MTEERKPLTAEEQRIKSEEFRTRRNEINAKRAEVGRNLLDEIDARIRKGEDIIIPAAQFNGGRFVFRRDSFDTPTNYKTKLMLNFVRYFDNALSVINNNRISSADLDAMKSIEDKFTDIIADLDAFALSIQDSYKDRPFSNKLAYKRNALINEVLKQKGIDDREDSAVSKKNKNKEAGIED
jgi:hypothetical protein